MNNIVFLSTEGVEYFNSNFDSYLDKFMDNKVHDIQKDLFEQDLIIKSDITFELVPLLHEHNSSLPSNQIFFENIKNIYTNLHHINIYQALNEGLWSAMYLTYYTDHLNFYTSSIKHRKQFSTNLKSSLLFTNGTKRSLIVNNLSRYWWIGHYLIDWENEEDPYHIIEFFTSSLDIVGKSMVTFSSNIFNNRKISHGVLLGIKKSIELGYIENKRQHYVDIIKELNIISAVTILDFYEKEDIIRITVNFFEKQSKGS